MRIERSIPWEVGLPAPQKLADPDGKPPGAQASPKETGPKETGPKQTGARD